MRQLHVIMTLAGLGISVAGPALGAERFTRTSGTEPVVADNVTGLVWQGCAAGLSDAACGTGSTQKKDWADAGTYCGNLTWASLDDWYLPDPKELRSIVDNRRYNPVIDTAAFPATPSDYFWTSSSVASRASYAWAVYFYGGGVVNGAVKSSPNHVRCVRRGP